MDKRPLPGDMVVVVSHRGGDVNARSLPQGLGHSVSAPGKIARWSNVVGAIPDDARVLYVSTLHHAEPTGKGPFGVRRDVDFHLVLWNDRPVWISSADANLVP